MVLGSVSGETGAKFRSLVRKLTSEGVMTTETRAKKDGDDQFGPQIFYTLTELSKLSPGELDPIMKENGYFLIDSNLPILDEGEEGDEIPIEV
jgi:hypothetical protein